MASTPLTGAFVAWAYRDPRFALLIPITTIPVLAFAVAFPSRILALQRLQFARAALPDHADPEREAQVHRGDLEARKRPTASLLTTNEEPVH